MPICTHSKIFSDFNLSFRFLTKKSIAKQIIAAMRRLNSFGVGKYSLDGANNRSNATQNMQEIKNCDHDRRREIRNRTILEKTELNSEHYPQVSIVMDIRKDLHSG